jgi:hypothetical protein
LPPSRAELILQASIKRFEGPRNPAEHAFDNDRLVGEFDLVTSAVFERLGKAEIRKGDLLLASTGEGTLGKAVVYDREGPALADRHITILRLDDQILPEYAAWFLRSEYGQSQINRFFTGATGLRHHFALSDMACMRNRTARHPRNLVENNGLELRQDVTAELFGVRQILRPQSPSLSDLGEPASSRELLS